MTCVKTGCHVYLSQYNEWVYGDAHRFGDTLIIRVAERGFKPLFIQKHYTALVVAHEWRDKPHYPWIKHFEPYYTTDTYDKHDTLEAAQAVVWEKHEKKVRECLEEETPEQAIERLSEELGCDNHASSVFRAALKLAKLTGDTVKLPTDGYTYDEVAGRLYRNEP